MAPVADDVTTTQGTAVGPAQVAAHVEALNLAGLGFAARRLLGKEPRGVANQFTMWARSDTPGLPPITTAYWQALKPLGIGRPEAPAARACEWILRGRVPDAELASAAVDECAAEGRRAHAAAPLPLPAGDTAAATLRRKALVDAVKDYWRAVGTVYGEVRARVLAGDQERAARLVARAEVVLRDVVEQVAVAATAVAYNRTGEAAGGPPTQAMAPVVDDAAAAEADAALGEDPAAGLATGRIARGALGDPAGAEDRAAAFARAERVREEPEPVVEARPVEVISTRPVREHAVLPIAFGVAVAALALLVIALVLNAPNPLAP